MVSCEGQILNIRLEGEIHQVIPVDKYSDIEEGITLCKSVVQGKEIIPVLIANTSGKTIKVWKGEEMGYASPLPSINQVRWDQERREKLGEKEIIAPERYWNKVRDLLRSNRDIVANEDKELEQTISMKIDTGK